MSNDFIYMISRQILKVTSGDKSQYKY